MSDTIDVETIAPGQYRIIVSDGRSQTMHEVTASAGDVARYAPETPPEQLLRASFAFLLEREPKEAILPRFDLTVIERYFPDYPRVIRTKV